MRRRAFLLLLPGSAGLALQKRKPPKPPEVTVLEIACHREGSDVTVDGRVQATSAKPLKGLQLFFDFLDSGGQLLTTKRGVVESELLAPGEEAEFRLRVAEPTRAVRYTLRAEDGEGRDLRLDKTGPFSIE